MSLAFALNAAPNATHYTFADVFAINHIGSLQQAGHECQATHSKWVEGMQSANGGTLMLSSKCRLFGS